MEDHQTEQPKPIIGTHDIQLPSRGINTTPGLGGPSILDTCSPSWSTDTQEPELYQAETITNLVAQYELPPNRHVEIHQSSQNAQYTAVVTQGNNHVVKPGFKTMDEAIDWARGQFPDLDVDAKEVSES